MKYVIPIQPVSKKNHMEIVRAGNGRAFLIPSHQYREYEKSAMFFIHADVTIDYPVTVKCLFYMGTRRKVDLTNLLEAIDDVLVKAGVLADDNYKIIESHDGSRVLYDKDHPRTEVVIERIEHDN